MAHEHFDAVVVGSGFGGAVSAYRLSESGHRVCVLERGQAYAPGEFPRGVAEMRANFWDPSRGGLGMYDFWSFSRLEALVCSGLGGGSLIYANVLMPMEESFFVIDQLSGGDREKWPVTLADLQPHYDNVGRMLNPQPYPIELPLYSQTAKAHALRQVGKKLGYQARSTPLGVTFANPGEPAMLSTQIRETVPSLHGVPRLTCRLCAECDIGCNTGSKNTLDHTYLSAAKHNGADLRTLCQVREFSPVRVNGRPGYAIRYVQYDKARAGKPIDVGRLPVHTVTADRLILAAGTLGTTKLLLRNHHHLPGIAASALGTRFSGNGDLLGFISNSVVSNNGTRQGRRLDPSHGPVITTTLRIPDRRAGGDGPDFYIQDGGFPDFVGWLLEGRDLPGVTARLGRFLTGRLLDWIRNDPRSNYGAAVSALFGNGGQAAGSMPLLAMGRDTPDGVLRLRAGQLDVRWTARTSRRYFARVRRTMRRIAAELEADYADNPLWLLRRVITVHPLGGAPMNEDPRRGVVDGYGQVHNHPGLYVVDGSAMPGPTGANPAMTIAAFADRAAGRFTERHRRG